MSSTKKHSALLAVLCVAVIHDAGAEPNFPNATTTGRNPSPAFVFQIHSDVIKSLESKMLTTTPFYDEQHLVTPRITSTVRPTVQTSTDGIALDVGISVSGSTSTQVNQSVGRHNVTVNVRPTISGNFHAPVHLSSAGIHSGQLLGEPQIDPHVQTYNDFRLPALNRGVHRIARRRADQTIGPKLVGKQKQMKERVRSSVESATQEANAKFKKSLQDLSGLDIDAVELPYRLNLSSLAATPGKAGNISLSLHHQSSGEPLADPPVLNNEGKAAVEFRIHESVINNTMRELFKGKTVKFGEAWDSICTNPLTSRLQLCAEQIDETLRSTSVTFDETAPIEVHFENNQLSLVLNVSHARQIGSSEEEKTELKGSKFNITVEYAVSPTGIQRTQLHVTPEGAGLSQVSHRSDHLLAASIRQVSNIKLEAEAAALRISYGAAFAKQAQFKPISIPAVVTIPEGGKVDDSIVEKTLSFSAKEVQTADGWFSAALQAQWVIPQPSR